MRVAVLGAGGVGGYFGGRLAEAGHEVVFIARGEHGSAIASEGLLIRSPLGDALVRPALVTDDPAHAGEVELVLVAVKAWQLDAVAEAMGPLVGPSTSVLPLLNGVEAPGRLADVLGGDRVLGGLCRVLASIEAPGVIRHSGLEPVVVLGERDGPITPRVERIAAALRGAEVTAEPRDDLQVALWEKFLVIATWSGMGAVTRVPIGAWRAHPGTRAIAEEGLREVVAVARALGVELPAGRVEKTLGIWDATPPEGIASMQRDILAGRPSELEAQSGAVVRLGTGAGVPTPVHRLLYHTLLPQEEVARASAGPGVA